MNPGMTKPAQNRGKANQQANPFARALAEMEQSMGGRDSQSNSSTDNKPKSFAEALAAKNDNFKPQDSQDNSPLSAKIIEQQQKALLEQQKKEALRKKLHDQINPVNTQELFNAREKQVLQKIDQLRQELSLLSTEVSLLNRDVELTLMTTVTNPGEQGAYYISFFEDLRTFIALLRKKVSSARTWATTLSGKQSKKKRRGMSIAGAGHEKTSTVHDMLHHERSSAYSGM